MPNISDEASLMVLVNTDAMMQGRGTEAVKIADNFRAEHFDPALAAYIAALNASAAKQCKWSRTGTPMTRFMVKGDGRQYVRIVAVDVSPDGVVGGGCRAHSFVDKGNGLIYKPATFKGPTLNFPRGSIYKLDEAPVTRVHGL